MGLEVQKTWEDEASLDDILNYIASEGTVIAAAKPGEPFRSLVDSPIDVFLGTLNEKLGGKAPVMRYIGDVNGVTTLEWGVLVMNHSPGVKIIIFDGKPENSFEIYPGIDKNFLN